MKAVDAILLPVIPSIILLHLLIAPYTKVEESFNIQATHDISVFGIPFQNLTSSRQNYDHFSFPGAVPRTFVGALALAGVSRPVITFVAERYTQSIVRAVLGLFNAFALLRYRSALVKAFGKDVGRWYVLLQAAQFHVMFYASRTLPNMFAFGLTTLALSHLLPTLPTDVLSVQKRQRMGIFLFVFAGVVFRSEIALLLFTQLLVLLVQGKTSLRTCIPAGIWSAVISLAISVPIDSFFWQKPIWPELAGFYYNAIQGKSADWGTSPLTFYFTNSLPRLLLNPLIFLLIPVALVLPSTRYAARDLVIPCLLFITIYSLQPHKESRFIIYIVPPLTAAASLSASYIWTRRSKSLLYTLGSLLLVASIAGSFLASTTMLLISSLNYPGGDALNQLHDIIKHHPSPADLTNHTINVHMDVLSCMTGVTRFLQNNHVAPPTHLTYDKTENDTQLLDPAFWSQFDYALMEEPGKAIGKWEVVRTVFAYAGIEVLRPGDGSSFSENLEKIYAANNLTKSAEDGQEVVLDSNEVIEEFESLEAEKEHVAWDEERASEIREMEDLRAKLLLEEIGSFGTFRLVRDMVRTVTGGYWIGPRMEPRIRILRRVQELTGDIV